jgi:hypothetical protein
MSTLKADTIVAADGSSPVTLTKQSAAKHWVNYDAVNQTTDGSFNQSSLTDQTTGKYYSTFTNVMSSAVDKVHVTSVINSINDGANASVGYDRGVYCNIGAAVSDSRALSASEVQFHSGYGARSGSDGGARDFSATYCATHGDLA